MKLSFFLVKPELHSAYESEPILSLLMEPSYPYSLVDYSSTLKKCLH